MIYFQSHRDSRVHEMGEDRPARKQDGTMCLLKDVPEGEDIQVFIETGWIPGWVRGQPTNFKFVVECVSFESEQDVHRALHKALIDYHNAPNSPIPWHKIVPPSKQPGTP